MCGFCYWNLIFTLFFGWSLYHFNPMVASNLFSCVSSLITEINKSILGHFCFSFFLMILSSKFLVLMFVFHLLNSVSFIVWFELWDSNLQFFFFSSSHFLFSFFLKLSCFFSFLFSSSQLVWDWGFVLVFVPTLPPFYLSGF